MATEEQMAAYLRARSLHPDQISRADDPPACLPAVVRDAMLRVRSRHECRVSPAMDPPCGCTRTWARNR